MLVFGIETRRLMLCGVRQISRRVEVRRGLVILRAPTAADLLVGRRFPCGVLGI